MSIDGIRWSVRSVVALSAEADGVRGKGAHQPVQRWTVGIAAVEVLLGRAGEGLQRAVARVQVRVAQALLFFWQKRRYTTLLLIKPFFPEIKYVGMP